ncbi:MAG TPA: hypothetical protein DCL15_05040, partial [Chloroflexi bacterium]|nr:hypothetical protein [Chloroflexota bacterium]
STTALIHLALGINTPFPTGWPFLLNAAGYTVLLLLYVLNVPVLRRRRAVVRWLLIAYAAVTVIAWWLMEGARTPLGYFDKIVEIVLIILLWLDGQLGLEGQRR